MKQRKCAEIKHKTAPQFLSLHFNEFIHESIILLKFQCFILKLLLRLEISGTASSMR